MKKVFIKYNPYKLETEITVDKKRLAQNSKLGEKADGSRLQAWVEELPSILAEEYNDNDFEIEFHGTLLDYEDIQDAFSGAQNDKLTFNVKERIPSKETSDKEALIEDVFEEIRKGPFEGFFDGFRDEGVIDAFNNAKSKDFKVCVVATMSAGKSTLINAMLGQKLMPSKQEACTAIITRIKDVSRDNIPFKAEVYNKENHPTETHERLTYSIMERLNADNNVSEIKVSGNIPFVSSEDVSLVLIDTPGPNNARDGKHKEVQSEFLQKESNTLVLYIMTGEFGTIDDDYTLKSVAKSMGEVGKQSKDRFIFVVNKLDTRKKDDGELENTLENVKVFLSTHGIKNPNIFPAAAEPALYIRLKQMLGDNADAQVTKIAKRAIEDFNENIDDVDLHFDKYSSLPKGIKSKIENELAAAKKKNDSGQEAVIHTGVVSIEAAIRQYVQKYAKTAKIKALVDTFMGKLKEFDYVEKIKKEAAENTKKRDEIKKQIGLIREKIDSAEDAKKFKDAVDDAIAKINNKSQGVIDGIFQKFQDRITKRIDDLGKKEFSEDEAEDEYERLRKFAEDLVPEFEVELNKLIINDLVNTSKALIDNYKKKLTELKLKELDSNNLSGIVVDPYKLMSGSSVFSDFSVGQLIREEERVVGEESYQTEVRTRGWFESIIFWPKDELVTRRRNILGTVRFVNASELAQNFFTPVEASLRKNGKNAGEYARKHSKGIADRFKAEFKRLDDVLKSKLAELESYATDVKKAEERVKESERKEKWLEQIIAKVESILEI